MLHLRSNCIAVVFGVVHCQIGVKVYKGGYFPLTDLYHLRRFLPDTPQVKKTVPVNIRRAKCLSET